MQGHALQLVTSSWEPPVEKHGGGGGITSSQMMEIARADGSYLCEQLFAPWVKHYAGSVPDEMTNLASDSAIKEIFTAVKRFQATGVSNTLTDLYYRTAYETLQQEISQAYASAKGIDENGNNN